MHNHDDKYAYIVWDKLHVVQCDHVIAAILFCLNLEIVHKIYLKLHVEHTAPCNVMINMALWSQCRTHISI